MLGHFGWFTGSYRVRDRATYLGSQASSVPRSLPLHCIFAVRSRHAPLQCAACLG